MTVRRVAAIPAAEFEAAIESDQPPTRFTFGVPAFCVCGGRVWITTNGRREVVGVCMACGCLHGQRPAPATARCAGCGGLLAPQPVRRGLPKRFCSARCRVLRWKRYRGHRAA